ncbi:MAG: RagB/SusD family nutrient uptake outer membrane protein [Bacteroidota bacterium]
MKNISLPFIFILLLASNACTKKLDQKPHQIYYDNYYQTEGDALTAVNAVYDVLGSVNQYSSYLWLIQDIGSDDCNARVTLNDPNLHEINNYTVKTTNNYIAKIWQGSYLGISRANIVLEKVPPISMDTALKARILGEARFLRGLYYFNLVRLFGDVPLVTVPVSPNLTPEEIYPYRSPVNKVYGLIIEDLKFAAAKLPAKYTNPNDKGRATSGAALGILSKVYLTTKEWEKAYSTALLVIESNDYALHPDYAANFKETNKNGIESVFEVQFYRKVTSENSQMVISGLPSIPGLFAAGVEIMLPTQDLLNSFDTNDYRKSVTFFDHYWQYTFEPHIWKYWDQVAYKPSATSSSGADFMVMRYSEVLLIYAEALNEANGGPTIEAFWAINKVRERARNGISTALPDLTGLNQDEFRKALLIERRHEFINEGHRWYDLVRTGTLIESVKRAKGDQSNPSSFNYLFPIPQREIDINRNLIQNTGY